MSLVGFTLLGSLEAPSLTGSASDVPLLVKPNTEFTVAMLASLDVGGGDLRFSSDEAGTTQLACEIADGLDVVWVSTDGLSVATGLTIYVWGDNTGASQPAVGAAFGRDAVWVDSALTAHLNEAANNTAGGYTNSTGGADGTGTSMSLANPSAPYGGDFSGFNGEPDEIIFPFNSSVSEITLSFWAKPDSLSKDQRAISIGNLPNASASDEMLGVWMDTDGSGDGWASILRNTSGTALTVIGANDSNASTDWQYVSVYISSTVLSTYVNGSLGSTTNPSFSNGISSANSLIISRLWTSTGTGNYFNGGLGGVNVVEGDARSKLAIEYDNQSAVGSWWIAADADTSLTAQGFTNLGTLKVPALGVGVTSTNTPMLVKTADFTTAMKASLLTNGNDLRLSSDEAGNAQLPIEIVDGLDVVWSRVPDVTEDLVYYVWGNKPAALKEIDTAPFGRNAVWVDYEVVIHANETGTNGVFEDSTGNGYNTTKTIGGALATTTGNPFGLSWPDFTQDETLAITGSSALVNNTAFTISSWINADVVNVSVGVLSTRYSGATDSATIRVDSAALTQGTGAFNVASGTATAVGVNTLLKAKQNTASLQSVANGSTTATTLTPADAETINNLTTSNTFRISGYFDSDTNSVRRLNGRACEFRIKRSKDTDDFDSIEYDNQSAAGSWWIAADAGGAISVTESLTALTIDSFNPSIDFTGVVSVTESLTNLNLNSFNPTIGLTATLTVTESLTNLEFNAFNPIVTLTPPNTIIVTESTTSLTIDSFDPTITFSGTISVTESLTNLDFRVYRPTVQVGAKEYTNIFYGVAAQQVTFAGTSVSSTFSGTIKQAPDFSGIITTSTFSGVSK